MVTMSPIEQQIANLRPSVGSGIARRLHIYLLASAGCLVLVSIVLRHPVPLMFAAFFALVGFGSRETGPLLDAAIRAYDMATPVSGQVAITVESNMDSNSYYALVYEKDQPNWKYEFIPQSWHPSAGTYPARIWRLKPETPPDIVAVEDGILIPRYKPSNVSESV
jgi:hypothetical protein